MIRKMTALTALGTFLSGCAAGPAFEQHVAQYRANAPDIDPQNVADFVAEQNTITGEFALLAGIPPETRITEWRPIVDAGIHYIDVRCDRFMDSLFWLNRMREGLSRQTQYTGAAVSAALAVVEASKNAIGLTPLGFSLVDQTINNLGAGLLFNLNPSTVRVLVEKRQAAYITALSASYSSKLVALRVIQSYAAICLPAAIETEVERAIGDREYEAKTVASALPSVADDVVPNAFQLPSVNDAPPGAEVISDAVKISGIGGGATVKVTNGEYRINNGAFVGTDGKIYAGQTISVRVKSDITPGNAVRATLDIGGETATFEVKTRAATPAGPLAPATASPALVGDPQAPVVSTDDVNALPAPEPK